MNVALLYRRRWGLFYLPVVALAIAAIAWAATRWLPLPPRNVTIAAGSPQGNYVQVALRYRDELEQRGITVDISTSALGAAGPLQRLASPQDASQAGFAHGLLAERGAPAQAAIQALAVVGKQAVWVFTRVPGVNSIAQLRGLRIAAGPVGAPQRRVAGLLLSQAQLRDSDVLWLGSQGLEAANELLEGRVDAVVAIGSGDSPSARLMSRSAGVFMVGVERANALAAREPRLGAVLLPQGAIELRGDVPPRDLTLLYTGTHLLVREAMHPALQRAFLDAANDIHSIPTFLQRQAEYPSTEGADFPLSPHALRHALGDRPWLETALPYWWAQLAALLLYAVLPILLVTGAALVWIPRLFSLRVNAVLSHYYGELKFVENDIDNVHATPMAMNPLLAKLDAIEAQVRDLKLPHQYADRWYTLRQHLSAARERLLGLRAR